MIFENLIVVDGNDGTGKSTLVRNLRLLGFSNVRDRGEMTKATDDDAIGPAPGVTYILMVCPPEVSKARLIAAGRDMSDPYHTDEALWKYDARFRALADRFHAHVITSVDEVTSLRSALNFLNYPIRVGMPTGRLKGAKSFGPIFSSPAPTDRSMVEADGHVIKVWTRTKSYPQMVALGTLDTALVGADALHGNPWAEGCRIVETVVQEGLRVVLAGRSDVLPKTRLLKVATPFPEWCSLILSNKGIPHTVYPVAGGSEALVAGGIVDVIFDIVETGATLRDNGLHIIEDCGPVETCVICTKNGL